MSVKNKFEKQKSALLVISIIGMVLGAGIITGAVFLLVWGITQLKAGNVTEGPIIAIVFGAITAFFGPVIFIWGFRSLFLSIAVKNTRGSIAQDNMAKVGTINMKKCPNCGAEVKEGDKCCGKCGHSLTDKKVCPKCGCTNTAENKKCSNCGADLD